MASDLEIRIGAELGEINAALAGLKREFAKVGQEASKVGGPKAFAGLETGLKSAASKVGALVAGLASIAAVIKTIGVADELNTLNARLRLVTGSTEEFAQAQVKLFDLAQRSRASFAETIKLYSQIANATKDAGIGQEVLLGVVETINQAVQLSGASTQAAEAALVQLGQGLASGTLRGEELNSILEQTPALADAIAKGLGVTRGELRALGQDGKITAEQVIKALQQQRDAVATQFAQLPVTVGQSLTLLRNAGTQLIGVFDTVTGSTGGLANTIADLAAFLSSDEVIGSITQFATAFGNAFADLARDAAEAVAIIKNATGGIAGGTEDLIQLVTRAFIELPANLRTTVRVAVIVFAGMVDSFLADAALLRDGIRAIFTDDTLEAAIARRNARVNAAAETVKGLIEQEVEANRGAADDAKKAAADAVAARAKARAATGSTAAGNFNAKPSADQLAKAVAERKAQLDAEEKLLKDSVGRQVTTLETLFEDGRLAVADYFRARNEIELAALDASIAVERRRASAGGVEAVKAKAEIETLERQKTDIQEKNARARFKFEADLEKQLGDLRVRDLEGRGQTAEAAKIKIAAEFADLLKRLEAEGNTAGVELVRKLINAEGAKAEFDQLKREFDRVLADLQARQQQIADQAATGAIAPGTANEEQSAARRQAAVELDALNAKLQELARNTNDPAIIEGARSATEAVRRLAIDSLGGIDAALVNLRGSLAAIQKDFATAATGAGVDALTNLFTDITNESKSAGEAIGDFAKSFVQSMAQIAARALATYLVLQLLEAVFPGAGRLLAAGGGATAGVNHRGGMAGSGPRRRVDPLLFAGAPRYHSGGMVGLKSDERPAVLQTGEEVLARNDPRNAANGGDSGGGGSGYRIVNVLDPGLVSSYLESASGEKTVLNVIARNPGAVRQMVGGK